MREFAGKGRGVKKYENFADVICVSPLSMRKELSSGGPKLEQYPNSRAPKGKVGSFVLIPGKQEVSDVVLLKSGFVTTRKKK